MTDEPMVERLTDEELERSRDILTRFPDFRENPVLARWMATIAALTKERDDLVEQLTVWKAAWAQLARNQVGPIAAYDQEDRK